MESMERNNGNPMEEQPANVNGVGVNARQAPVGTAPRVDATTANTTMLQGIQGLLDLFGQLLQHLSIGGQAPGAAAVPPHGAAGDVPLSSLSIPRQGPPSVSVMGML